MELWRKLYEPLLIALLLYLVSSVFLWCLNRRLAHKNPNLVGLRVIEECANQRSVRLKQPGNLIGLIEEDLIKKRMILNLDSMEEEARKYAVEILRAAKKASGGEILDLGENIYAVDDVVFTRLPREAIHNRKLPRREPINERAQK